MSHYRRTLRGVLRSQLEGTSVATASKQARLLLAQCNMAETSRGAVQRLARHAALCPLTRLWTSLSTFDCTSFVR
jgi:hypothetical protein